ncbi:MAG TPA: ABC transporter permease [Mycobacteriales bacterium]|jgi:ABC-type spermidine/putrescine transport system permease subunit II|nr:ABC transporter permease [Mycobacteriales bacterium]
MATASPAVRRRRPFDVPAGLMRVWAVLVYAFLYLPILFVVVYSFNKGRRLQIWDGLGTRWYGDALGNEEIRQSLGVSLRAAALVAVLSVVLGGTAGIALARRGGGWSKPFLVLLFMILVTPEIVDAIAFLIWFVRIDMDLPLARLVVGHSIFSSAVVTLIVRARLQGLDESLEEAAADLGATPFRAFRQITLPLMLPAVIAGALLAFTFSLDDVVISSFVSIAGTTTLPTYVFSSVRTGLKGNIAAISTMMLGLTFLALVIAAVVLRRSGDSAEEVTATLTGA